MIAIADNETHCRFSDKSLPKKTVDFGNTDTLKIILTAKEGGKAKRPHQAFLTLQETETGLEAPFVFTTKESGKATVDIVRQTRQLLRARFTCPRPWPER